MTDRFGHDEVERFRSLVSSRLGLHFDNGRTDMLADALRLRLRARGRVDCGSYLDVLEAGNQQEEWRDLTPLLTVAETYFYRSPEHFRVLADVVVPERLRTLKRGQPIRILSAGCASGDEPYSAALVLRERFPELRDPFILGFDLNPQMLAKAADARYSSWSLRELREDLRKRYFASEGQQFLLDREIRRMVKFEERNLAVENGTPWNLEQFDIIFCRNTIMYLTPEAARLAVVRLTRALVPDGFLFLSHAENLRGLSEDFRLCHTHDTFYYRKKEGASSDRWPAPPAAFPPPEEAPDFSWMDSIRLASERIENLSGQNNGAGLKEAVQGVVRRPNAASQMGAALQLMGEERFREALELVHGLPADVAGDRDVLLLQAALLANCGEVNGAQAVCAKLLAADDLNAGAQYLTALCREHAADYRGAMEHDRAAIYLDPAFAMPHLHLGLLAKRAGDLGVARSELEHACVLLKREDASRILLLGGGFSRQALLELSRAELQACGGRL
jgi:chemotaxis protein methyltransferase CheR